MTDLEKNRVLISSVLEESMRMKKKAQEIKTWLLKLDLDPNKDLAYITMVGYIEALEFVIQKAKTLNEGANDKTYGAKLFNRN